MHEKRVQLSPLFSEKYKGERMQLEKAQRDLRSNIKHEFKGTVLNYKGHSINKQVTKMVSLFKFEMYILWGNLFLVPAVSFMS